MTHLSERAEEILETLWGQASEGKPKPVELGLAEQDPAVSELCQNGMAKRNAKSEILLTAQGLSAGEKIVRRHRLSERLFADVLDIKESLVHPVSCKFEHLLYDGIEDNICILLGHPTTCPHGRPIPPGECCRKQKAVAGKVVSALSGLEVKHKGKVAYIQTRDQGTLQKLMAMNILPGMNVSLIQKYPSYVFQIGQSQFAVDQALADAIFIRKGA